MRRRDFLMAVGAATAWPLMARAQQSPMPVVGFLSGRSLASDSHLVATFSRALNEAGYVNGQNVAIEFRWADGQLNRLPELVPLAAIRLLPASLPASIDQAVT